MGSLKGIAAPVMARLREHRERPEALDMLKQSLNSSRVFLEKSRDLVIPAKPKDTPETISVEEQEKREKEWKEATEGIDWSKLGDNIKSFFGTDEAKPEEAEDDKEKSDDKKDDKKSDSKKK